MYIDTAHLALQSSSQVKSSIISFLNNVNFCITSWHRQNPRQTNLLSLETFHKDIKGNKKADIAAKSHKMEESKAEKWKMEGMGLWLHIKRAKARKIACYHQASSGIQNFQAVRDGLDKWEDREKALAICPKPTKKTLEIHRVFCKAASALIVQMQTEKIGLKKFLHSRKVPGYDSSESPCRRGLQSAKHLLIECRLHTQKKNRI